MKKTMNFLFLEICIFLIIGLITLLEIINFKLFESFFAFIKTPSSWFVGFGLAYAFSNLFQKTFFSIFSKKIKGGEKNERDFFIGFLITLMITSLITPFVRSEAAYLLNTFFIYFHIILMQCVLILYILFKLKEGFEISGKYFLTNELILLLNLLFIVQFITI